MAQPIRCKEQALAVQGSQASDQFPVASQTEAGLRPCPVCYGWRFDPLFDLIQRCMSCGLALVNPLGSYRGENETEDYFLNDYLPLHLANRENSLAERRSHLALIRQSFPLPLRPRLLDVGCALGSMLQVAQEEGWNATGVESAVFAARYAAEHTGCFVHAGTLQNAGFGAESFDVVTLMDVIEHVAEPRALMVEVHRVLRPGGVVFIVTPNFGSLFVRLYGLKAYGVWPDQHVVYFQPSTISRLLRTVGFSKVKTGTKDFYAANLQRFLSRRPATSADIKAAFGVRSSWERVRRAVNAFFRYVPLGDKLVACARK